MRISDWSSDVCSSDLSRIPRSGSDVHEVDRDYCLRSISVPFRVRSEAQQVDDRVVGREAAELLRRGQNKHGAYEARMQGKPGQEPHSDTVFRLCPDQQILPHHIVLKGGWVEDKHAHIVESTVHTRRL